MATDITEVPAKKIVFTGGGSGGHLNAALAVIQEFQQSDNLAEAEIVYVGGLRGMINDPTPSLESRKVPEQGIRFIGIRSGKLHRRLNFYTLKLLWGVIGGLIDSWRTLKIEKPDLVFSTGGYVSLPVVICSRLLGIKSIIHEQTIVSGLANRVAAKFASKVLISFPGSAKYFPAKKIILTGNPLQKSRFETELPADFSADYRKKLEQFVAEKTSRPFVFITGGGLGSHKLNTWFLQHLEQLGAHFNVLIQTGENELFKDFDTITSEISRLDSEVGRHLFVTKWFGSEIGYIYAHADVVIARPGANTVLELLATNRRAVLIPIPWSSQNEQQLNAEYFCQNQTGTIVNESDIQTHLLPALQDVLSRQAKQSTQVVIKDAAGKIRNILLKELPQE